MTTKNVNEEDAKAFLQHVLASGEKWLAEEVKKIYDQSSDQTDFLEEVSLYLTRLELKLKALKEECEKLISL
ncbi:MAG: hypothetical protein A2Z91_01010 [Deltaproteobacteria bacterium GWA2_38_16]|nr:MAG: hypothetical protein A2Z91_01010 [Deltaproteobacteria bacterium GWA2_38_16]OGQ02978.1 MAG: hypothetical protein A3D19_01020 [Deltaproteobacteria bacterium RIFCSPHIGHO2_02_FULL_38_15]OGQ34519.1 MAG: hypothetical protein A3A72_05160 [Deltaproteobacteria bacterium RIFCSPLOWO2_01_FULL_38_9]OGQ59221.1 MAG: hypothetical protein A3G92_06895 [Deltaproteobacteria bacterium RIFCSPLOWO2_12_FULL_38_8]HBQ21921.1 hypothetical protein [Deltaproteobacteria bacterium]